MASRVTRLSPLAVGTGKYFKRSPKSIRFVRKGCTNRPFFHIVVMETFRGQQDATIEQVGTYDPMPNEFDEQLIAFNFERIRYWIGNGARLSTPVAELLGISGFLPIHPRTYMTAWRNRNRIEAQNMEENITNEENVSN